MPFALSGNPDRPVEIHGQRLYAVKLAGEELTVVLGAAPQRWLASAGQRCVRCLI
jgi:hypothetical protein